MSDPEFIAAILVILAGIVASLAWPAAVAYIIWTLKRDSKRRCKGCDGQGWRFTLPSHVNAFHARLPALARMMQKVPCWECRGTGQAKASKRG